MIVNTAEQEVKDVIIYIDVIDICEPKRDVDSFISVCSLQIQTLLMSFLFDFKKHFVKHKCYYSKFSLLAITQ